MREGSRTGPFSAHSWGSIGLVFNLKKTSGPVSHSPGVKADSRPRAQGPMPAPPAAGRCRPPTEHAPRASRPSTRSLSRRLEASAAPLWRVVSCGEGKAIQKLIMSYIECWQCCRPRKRVPFKCVRVCVTSCVRVSARCLADSQGFASEGSQGLVHELSPVVSFT